MNRRHLLRNFVDNLEALFRKTRAKLKKRSSTLQQEASSNQEDHRNLSSKFEAMPNKSEFSAPTTDNIHTGPAAEICNTLGVKHAFSPLTTCISILINHKHHEHVILLRIWFYVHHFMCFKYVKNRMLASKIVKYSN